MKKILLILTIVSMVFASVGVDVSSYTSNLDYYNKIDINYFEETIANSLDLDISSFESNSGNKLNFSALGTTKINEDISRYESISYEKNNYVNTDYLRVSMGLDILFLTSEFIKNKVSFGVVTESGYPFGMLSMSLTNKIDNKEVRVENKFSWFMDREVYFSSEIRKDLSDNIGVFCKVIGRTIGGRSDYENSTGINIRL